MLRFRLFVFLLRDRDLFEDLIFYVLLFVLCRFWPKALRTGEGHRGPVLIRAVFSIDDPEAV